MSTNSRYNGMTIDNINKFAKSPLKCIASDNGRDYYEGEKRPGYYRPVLVARDGVVKQGFWFSESEEVQAMLDRKAARKEDRQTRRTSYANGYKTTLENAERRRVQDDVLYTGNYR